VRGLFIPMHKPRVARHVSRNDCCQPASDPTWLLLLHGQVPQRHHQCPDASAASLGLGTGLVNKWNLGSLRISASVPALRCPWLIGTAFAPRQGARRARPKTDSYGEVIKKIMYSSAAAILLISALMLSYGMDLSPGFF